MIGTSNCSSQGNSPSITPFNPGFWRPIAFSIPDAVSATRGVGLPSLVSSVVALIIIAPSNDKSYSWPYSLPNPKQPDAGIIGFFNDKPGNSIDSLFILPPPQPGILDHLSIP